MVFTYDVGGLQLRMPSRINGALGMRAPAEVEAESLAHQETSTTTDHGPVQIPGSV